MTTQSVHHIARKLPFEIKDAVSAFDNETRQAIIITLLNEGQLRFSELRDHLSDDEQLHNQTLTNALEALQDGGLVNKRVADSDSERIQSYYEVSEYGERFVDCLLDTLGSVDNFDRHQPQYEPVENIQHSDGEAVAIEAPVDLSAQQAKRDEPASSPGQ